jgi:uncharacterized protein
MMNKELSSIITRYRELPDFFATEWTNVDARGACGDTMLHVAVVREDRSDVARLIELGANVNAIGDLGNTPLHDAASRGLVEIIGQLVKAGAKLNISNEFGQTPIDLARLMQKDKRLKDTLRALQGH